MKILFLAQRDVSDTSNGNAQRTHRLYERLVREGHDIDVVLWPRFGSWRIVSALFRRLFYPAELSFPQLPASRAPWRGKKYDLVVARYLNTAARARAWEIAPCKVDVDDLPSTASASIWSRKWPPGLRWLPRLVVERWERRILGRLAGAWVSNPADAPYVSRFCPCETFPNKPLPPRPGYDPVSRRRRMLLFVGVLGYPPNAEGVRRFVREVWPRVRSAHPDWEFIVAGAGKPPVRAPGVRFAGFVEDLDSLYEESAAVVAPVFSGAGTSLKVLEALDRGRDVFATPCAARGIAPERFAGRLRVSRDAGSMASAICDWISSGASGLANSATPGNG